MKSILYSLTMTLCLLASCQKALEPEDSTHPDTGQQAMLAVDFSCPQMDPVSSRMLSPSQEEQIKDINLYLFHKVSGTCKRQYITGKTSLSLELPRGEYDIYAIANYGADLGGRSKSSIESLQKTISAESGFEWNGVLPMSCFQTITVSGNMSLRIVLRRIVARIDVTVNIASSVASQISLHTITLVNAPKSCRYFGENTPTMGFMTYDRREYTEAETVSFYQFENCQGINGSITNPKHKSRENAPANGSYLHIEGRTADKLLDYYIYLGENTTSDFNVYGNRNYSLTINVQGISQTDWRIEVSDGTKIDVAITQADRTTKSYALQNQFNAIASDNTLDVTVTLSQPSRWDVIIPVQGVIFLLNEHAVIIEEQQLGSEFFFADARIKIPAGTTRASARFYVELRKDKGNSATLFFNECTITRFITSYLDRNIYNYTSGYFTVKSVKSETVYGYPND